MTKPEEQVFDALQEFAAAVRAKTKALARGAPEDQLRGPLENFLTSVGKAIGRQIVAKGESQLAGRLGRPDYAVLVDKLLAGYIELKEPGKGADPEAYKGHDREQWKRFQSLPNLIYTDGNEWGLFRQGKAARPIARLSGDITKSGKAAVKSDDVQTLKPILIDFFWWEPVVPDDSKALADLLAPLCRTLREEVKDAVKGPASSLRRLAKEWRELLFPEADDDRFADAYAQTVTFALLLARSEGARTIEEDLPDAIQKLSADHALLSRALQVLTDKAVREEISPPLRLLERVIDCVTEKTLRADKKGDPWLYFYEHFLAAYDPELRKDAGAYYTPAEVVHAQVRLIDRLLTEKLGKPMGFADGRVITLDPAVGTGTYLLGVIDHVLGRAEAELGRGALAGQAAQLGRNLYGFENMVGPYAVAQLRVSRSLMDRGAALPESGPGIYLTDTLESPHAKPPKVPLFHEPLAEQHKRALEVKENKPVIVCLGNPPYDRHPAAQAASAASRARTGNWVRWGEFGDGSVAIFNDFLRPALDAGHGVDVKNLYNLYVYFWRWALWKVFEHETAAGPGVVSYISAASYLDGDAFVGVREHMRRQCDEVWVIDVGGEGRGTRKSQNVFAIQTPVAIAVAVCYGKPKKETPAKVHYTRIEGSREEKLAKLDSITRFSDLKWKPCPQDWQASFRPAGTGSYFDWPLFTDLMPWQHSGVQLKRTWPIVPDEDILKRRWEALLKDSDRAKAFRETGDRVITRSYKPILPNQEKQLPIAELESDSAVPRIQRYAYRSFDRQWIIADGRLMSRPRPELWRAHGEQQVYLTSLLYDPIGRGPALTACAEMPDLHYFSGRGAKDIVPLFRDSAGQEPNILPGMLDLLGRTYKRNVSPQDLVAYLYGLLAQASFTRRFMKELETRQLRVSQTKDAGLFWQVVETGERLLWLHTYGQRFSGPERPAGKVPRGTAKCTKAVSEQPEDYPDSFEYNRARKRLTVGTGVFEPVEPEVFEFEVSGLKVVQSWLGYRMKSGKGKKSSPLDEIRPTQWPAQFTTELLELLWVLEATLASYPEQAKLLEQVLAGPLFQISELPAVPESARKPPGVGEPTLFESDEEGE